MRLYASVSVLCLCTCVCRVYVHVSVAACACVCICVCLHTVSPTLSSTLSRTLPPTLSPVWPSSLVSHHRAPRIADTTACHVPAITAVCTYERHTRKVLHARSKKFVAVEICQVQKKNLPGKANRRSKTNPAKQVRTHDAQPQLIAHPSLHTFTNSNFPKFHWVTSDVSVGEGVGVCSFRIDNSQIQIFRTFVKHFHQPRDTHNYNTIPHALDRQG